MQYNDGVYLSAYETLYVNEVVAFTPLTPIHIGDIGLLMGCSWAFYG